jgi:alkanesulfonate monooxygenase SsuD/methylene tetrahydromethanopterin reductase-like flavin-dependent oxidoreductase (luciferase family)
VKFATNRLDLRGPRAFADSAARAEDLGWSMGLIPCSPLLVSDPYVSLALAAEKTTTLHLGTLLDTPVLRHPSVLASSIATVAALAPNRMHLGLGVGDTAVRLNGLAPATVRSLEDATAAVRSLLAGETVDVGASRPARLRHAASVPVWIAAQGPKTLHMAGAVADGVWIRVGTHPANLEAAWRAVCDGAEAAGRSPDDLELGLIFHTTVSDDRDAARRIGKAIAAGYFEYSKFLFDGPGFTWNGPDVHELQQRVWPDFHHHRDPLEAGAVVDFLAPEIADGFALNGTWDEITEQLEGILKLPLPVRYVIPHPVLPPNSEIDFISAFADRVMPHLV